MNVDPHWLEGLGLLVLGALGFMLRRDVGRIDRKLDLVDQHNMDLAVLKEQSRRHDLERNSDRKAISDLWNVLAKHKLVQAVRRADRE